MSTPAPTVYPSSPPLTVTIESVDHEGHGIARVEGKAVFVEGALPGETVEITIKRRKPTFDTARVDRIVHASAQRVTPQCPHFGVCGGCSGQHQHWQAQVAVKQRVLEDCLSRIGKVTPDQMLPPLFGVPWGYRHRARLSVRDVEKKGGVLVGFHEKGSSYVADMRSCEVLPPHMSALLVPLRALVGSLSIRKQLPQIEMAIGDDPDGASTTALVLRIMAPLTSEDETALRAFADTHCVQFYLQTKGPETAVPFYPTEWTLGYTLAEFGLRFRYKPTEFTQVNPHINARLIHKAITLLAPQAGERVADLFCGLGNFSLPIARRGATVVGVEGAQGLVDRANHAAEENGLRANTEFRVSNLFAATPESLAALGHLDRMLIDPPRDGALEVCKSLPHAQEAKALKRIVYVSCSPSTLARDAAVLVHERGYRMRAAGIANMFPHTSHVESIAMFEP